MKEVPELYVQIEHSLRQLRVSRRDNQEGQQGVFYTLEELQGQLKNVLLRLRATEQDFRAAIHFIHQVELVW